LYRKRAPILNWHSPGICQARKLKLSVHLLGEFFVSHARTPPLPAWHEDRVVLIGDAAHAMSPSGGQGASLALEDAMHLVKLLC
jgi:2-polyprenyl-6-methoxyphenol hydroxylase-like FAD-dependent oxidoreductase